MELSIEEFELMEAYFRGELSEAQKESFEKRIKTNAGFQKEVLIQAKIREGFRGIASKNINPEIKEEIAAAGKRYHSPSRPTSRPFSMAASVLIVLSLGWAYRVQYYIPEDAQTTAKTMQHRAFSSPLPQGGTKNIILQDPEWEKALTIIAGRGKKSEAKKILKKIAADSTHPQQKNAQTLLEKL